LGADDYVTKPFSPREVAARVRAVLRRARRPGSEGDRIDVGSLRIDSGGRIVRFRDRAVTLTTLEFDLLLALASSPGRVFTRRQLLERVWGWDFFGDERVVDVHIRNLRNRLGDDAQDPAVVATVRGVGYKLVNEPR
jgi:DNA-binding response OmpR family regulator